MVMSKQAIAELDILEWYHSYCFSIDNDNSQSKKKLSKSFKATNRYTLSTSASCEINFISCLRKDNEKIQTLNAFLQNGNKKVPEV